MNETLDLAIELNTEHANFYAVALPGSPLYTQALKQNLEIPKKFEELHFYLMNVSLCLLIM